MKWCLQISTLNKTKMYISAKGLFVKRNRKRSNPKAHLVVREAEKKKQTQTKKSLK